MKIFKLAVVLIHMQENFLKFFDKSQRTRLIEKQVDVIVFCRKNNIPVFLIEYPNSGNFDQKILKALKDYEYCFWDHSGDNIFEDNLAMKVRKKTRSIFPAIFLMGIHANACILKSVKGARKKLFPVFVSSDTIGNPRENNKDYEKWFKRNTIFRKNWTDILQ